MTSVASKNLKFLAVLGLLVSSVFLLTQSAFAAVTIANQTGTVKITAPDGQVATVEAGNPLPNIPAGSTIEVVTGKAEISASDGDTVNVLVNDSTVQVGNGAKVSVRIDLRTGNANLDVVAGNVQVLNPDGTTTEVNEGGSYEAPASEPTPSSEVDTPGTDPAQNTGRQEDAESGKVSGY